jgi:hypothetical protein
MAVFLITTGFFALFFILMSVRLIFLKNGEFRGTCASQSPWLNKEGIQCGYCGKTLKAGDACGDPEAQASASFPEIKKKEQR